MWAEEGRVVIAERYPVDGNEVLVGPSVPSTLTPSVAATAVGRWLIQKESSLYQKLPPPDAAFVLRVDPEEAVRRKVNEPADYVKARNRAIAAVDWQARGATVVDANVPPGEVLRRLKQGIWEAL
jgi:thymidylate kinase